jgi:hypothetical protein
VAGRLRAAAVTISIVAEASAYIGLTEEEARQEAEADGLVFRPYYPGMPITAEWRSGRVSVFVVDGHVRRADFAEPILPSGRSLTTSGAPVPIAARSDTERLGVERCIARPGNSGRSARRVRIPVDGPPHVVVNRPESRRALEFGTRVVVRRLPAPKTRLRRAGPGGFRTPRALSHYQRPEVSGVPGRCGLNSTCRSRTAATS